MGATTQNQAEARAQRALDREAYERFQPIVRRIAIRMARKVPRQITVADLVSCGWLGLIEAYSRAVPTMPAEEFEAYASYRIRGAMLDYLRSLDPATREVRRTSRKIATAIRKLQRDLDRAPTEEEIARELGMASAAYEAALNRIAAAGMARLEMLDFDEVELGGDDVGADEECERRELVGVVADAIQHLPPRHQKVLTLYYQQECTLKEIGAVLGVTESRVSQMHTEAMHRLRATLGKE